MPFRLVLTALVCLSPLSVAGPPDIDEITIADLRDGYDRGEFSIEQVTRAYLDRIERIDRNGPRLNAMLTIHPNALERARELDAELEEDQARGPLHGIPVVIKDNIDTGDLPTTAGSVFLAGSVPPADAFVIERLREAGAVILGKANLSEWANFHSTYSSSGWSRLGGQVRNPYALERNPCGSSSGSAVAVSANLAAIAIGTETNGSIVCPAHANGVVGLKPTVGLWSRSGIIPISHTLDSAGPMTRSVADAAVLLGLLAGRDTKDEKTAAAAEHIHQDYTRFLDADGLEGKRIGLYTGPLGNHHRIDALVERMVGDLIAGGAEVVEIDTITEMDISASAFEVLLTEFHHGINQYLAGLGEDAPVADFPALVEKIRNDPEESAWFDRNLFFMSAERDDMESDDYLTALENMQTHSRDKGIDRVIDEHDLDAIVAPTGSPAWKTDLTLGDNFGFSSSSPSARAGYPIITVPMGEVDGLPVGVSFFGTAWSEPVLLEIAYAYEQATGHRRQPSVD